MRNTFGKKGQSDNEIWTIIRMYQKYFSKNQAQNMVEKLIPYLFLKNQVWACLWINSLKFLSLILLHVHTDDQQIILKLRCWPLEIFLTLYSINWATFIAWLPILLHILGNIHSVITCLSIYDLINYETNFSFLIMLFF